MLVIAIVLGPGGNELCQHVCECLTTVSHGTKDLRGE